MPLVHETPADSPLPTDPPAVPPSPAPDLVPIEDPDLPGVGDPVGEPIDPQPPIVV